MKITKIKNLSLGRYFQLAGEFWMKKYKLFFILLFLGAMGYGGFVWYNIMYHFGWSDQQKQQYTLTQNRSIDLKEEAFNNIINNISQRKDKFATPNEKIKDIFKSE
jgi:hypothetical protein